MCLFKFLLLVNVCFALPLDHAINEEPEEFYEKNIEPRVLEIFNDWARYEERLAKSATMDETSQELMQSDQPQLDDNYDQLNSSKNRIEENKLREKDAEEDRAKQFFKHYFQMNTLQNTGRINSTNISDLHLFLPNLQKIGNQVTEKIRSFYPSCEVPNAVNQDMWKDENVMNLFFSLNQIEGNVAMATLRLHRTLMTNSTNNDSCENSPQDEDKLFRVTSYYYTKCARKHRVVKRKISDCKMMNESSKWIELNMSEATRAWIRGGNLGVAIQVEDQFGTIMKADTFFKGAACTVGSSTPKPIPTAFQELYGRTGGDPSASFFVDRPMYPKLDVCTLEAQDINKLSREPCRLHAEVKTRHTQRPIRHQKHQERLDPNDVRSKIKPQKIVVNREQLQGILRDFDAAQNGNNR